MSKLAKPSREEAEAAVKTLLAWAGDDTEREGLVDTPRRVVNAYEQYFKGYDEDPIEILGRRFDDVGGYDDIVLLRDINFHSHCEHHMAPFIGKAHVAYIPNKAVVGISKIARVVDIYARRLQIQEKMTMQIADAIEEALQPRGVAVFVQAEHQCMSMRGVMKPNVDTITTQFRGEYNTPEMKAAFMSMIRS
ncbi:MAG: GTP cyclohydrolase I FolE [Alphaproteobacteria bacterium]|nr:GTP cyclohydrolase I FolE [Alphaproteobacteria bacterium]